MTVVGPGGFSSFHENFVSQLPAPVPLTTPGHVTGGGQITMPDGKWVTFALEAKSDASTFTGHCNVLDNATHTHVKCLDVTSFVQVGTHVTFSGRARVNGVETRYTIDVDDLGEPGSGLDAFRIETDVGYSVGGVVEHGNIQVHRSP